MKRKSSIPEEKLLPYETICAATRGDPDAMTEVLRHFDGYISYQATRIFYDEYGQSLPALWRGSDLSNFPHSPGAGIWRPLHLPAPGISCTIR